MPSSQKPKLPYSLAERLLAQYMHECDGVEIAAVLPDTQVSRRAFTRFAEHIRGSLAVEPHLPVGLFWTSSTTKSDLLRPIEFEPLGTV